MEQKRSEELYEVYRHSLLDDVVPFWLRHSLDQECGGYLHCLDRDGSVFNTDKGMWVQCRETWLFSKLYNTLESRKEWLDAARHGFDFIMKYGFDTDGRMFYAVTRDGRPLRKHPYLYTETFGVIACAEYAKATGDKKALEQAKDLYRLVIDLYRRPGSLPPEVLPQTRAVKSHGMPMVLLNTTAELQQVDSDPLYKEVVDDALDQIMNHFLKREKHALLETVDATGRGLDSPEGRCVNPGHAIETAWFIMQEGHERGDSSLIKTALDILNWSLDWGWDREYGGILSYVDIEGRPPEQLEWDMKLWWPHTEALYALLLAHHLSGEAKYLDWYEKVYQWSFSHFPDPEHGEWFGYLHRDGSVSLSLKGSLWKGPFHLPRTLLQGLKLLERMGGMN